MSGNEIARVFVYGSLKQGEPLFYYEPLMELRLDIQAAMIQGAVLYDLGPYPGMVLQADGGTVYGEVHHFGYPVKTLAILDQLEGYYGEGHAENFYRRVEHDTQLLNEKNARVSCWVYEYVGPMDPGFRRLESGVWEGVKDQERR